MPRPPLPADLSICPAGPDGIQGQAIRIVRGQQAHVFPPAWPDRPRLCCAVQQVRQGGQVTQPAHVGSGDLGQAHRGQPHREAVPY
jgi:hypothetical protein